MNINMEIPGLKDVIVEKIEELNDKIAIHVKLPLGTHTCPNCGRPTKKVHDYRVQKVNHLKWFERLIYRFLYYLAKTDFKIDTASSISSFETVNGGNRRMTCGPAATVNKPASSKAVT